MKKCIYCGVNEATEAGCWVGCGCDETPDYMRADAPAVAPARRCVDCGEFTQNCECGSRCSSREVQFSYGGRVVRAGDD